MFRMFLDRFWKVIVLYVEVVFCKVLYVLRSILENYVSRCLLAQLLWVFALLSFLKEVYG